MSFLKEFWEFLSIRKKYWLLPIIIVLVIFGGFYIAFGILMFLFMLMNGSINMQDFRPPS